MGSAENHQNGANGATTTATASDVKLFTATDVETLQEKSGDKKCYLIIHGKVYEVADFLDEHPGGPEIVKEYQGTDATDEFDDIGHSPDALEMLKTYEQGGIKGYVPKAKTAAGVKQDSSSIIVYVIMALIAAAAAYFMIQEQNNA